MGTLIPGQALIYERANGITYARYRDPPHNCIPRWAIGWDYNMTGVGYNDFRRMQELAQSHEGFCAAWEELLTQYFLLKDIDTNI